MAALETKRTDATTPSDSKFRSSFYKTAGKYVFLDRETDAHALENWRLLIAK